jgi:hypothetical protein
VRNFGQGVQRGAARQVAARPVALAAEDKQDDEHQGHDQDDDDERLDPARHPIVHRS